MTPLKPAPTCIPQRTILLMGALVITMVLMPTSWTRAQPVEGHLENTEGFKAGFGMSFQGLDACGDRRLGELFRRALMDRFRRCPFSPVAKAAFEDWAEATGTRANAQLNELEHGGLPGQMQNLAVTCREHRASADYQKLRSVLERYGRGEVSAEAVAPDRCDASPGAP